MTPKRAPSSKAASPLRALQAAGLWASGFILTYGAGVALLGGVGAPEPWIPVGAGMIAAVTFQAVGRRRAASHLPRTAHFKADERLGRALDAANDADQVAAVVAGTLRKTIKPRHAYFWLLDREQNTFVLAAGIGMPADIDDIPEARVLAWLAARGGAPDLSPEEFIAARELTRWLTRQELTWIEPVIAQGRQVGLLTIAARTDGRDWNHGERWLVGRMVRETGQALASIDLARTERVRRSRLDNLTLRYKDAQQRAITDGLTGLATHIFFKEQLALRFHEARRHAAPLSVLLLDIDHFKKINDNFGHPAGDEVLRQVAKAVKGVARACDTVARYGGEELSLVLPSTDLTGAAALGERLREAIADLEVADSRGRRIPIVTASLGVAELEVQDASLDDLIARADAALYLAKREGRNQVRRAS